MDFHKIWIEQCEAARGIEDEFGTQKALDYLVGEKFLDFLEAAETNTDFRGRSGPARLWGKIGWRGSAFCERILRVTFVVVHERTLHACNRSTGCG